MPDPGRIEKKIIIILTAALLVGTGVVMYRKTFPSGSLHLEISKDALRAHRAEAAPPAKKKININKASAAELESLKGVGKATALKIVEYRSNKGLFVSAEDIKKVSGIGEKLYSRIKDEISLE